MLSIMFDLLICWQIDDQRFFTLDFNGLIEFMIAVFEIKLSFLNYWTKLNVSSNVSRSLIFFARNSHQITLHFISFERSAHTTITCIQFVRPRNENISKRFFFRSFFFHTTSFHTWDCSVITKGMKSFTHYVCCIGMSVENITVKLFQRSVLTYRCSFSSFHLKYISHTYNFFYKRIEFFWLNTKYHLDTFVGSCVFPFVFVPSRMDAISIIDNMLEDDPNKIKSKQPKWSNVLCSSAL